LKTLLVLGSTGSIGTQTLELARTDPGLAIAGLAAGSSWQPLLQQVREFRPRWVAVTDPAAAEELAPHLPRLAPGTDLFRGPSALADIAREAEYDTAIHGVVGGAGLPASVAVLERGKTLALANKESLVIAGERLMALARERGGEIVPVDSEHSAIHQCLRGEDVADVRRVLLTASGGPFRTTPLAEMRNATPELALKHPNWDMGPRITIGSATLMNKALEVIELHHLFGLDSEQIEVVVHPQSIVHSMVEFVDGSVVAQMGPPDMRGPIHYAIHHPERRPADLAGFDFELFRTLTFEPPDLERFPTLELGFRCVREGSDSGCVLNAADEIAVEAFLKSQIGFDEIYAVNRAVLAERPGKDGSVEELLQADRWARECAREKIRSAAAAS